MRATDETAQLIWEGLLDTDRMCRYYGYLASRLERFGSALQIGTAGAASGAFLLVLAHFPAWVAAVAAALAALTGSLLAVQRYPQKSARSAEIYRELGRQLIDWEEIWAEVRIREDAELRQAWRELSRRQARIVERAPLELPLSKSIARRSEREADGFWAGRYAST